MNTKKKMTVKDFIKKYDALTSDKLKEDFLKTIVKDTYVSYENKITICEKIVEASYYVKNNERKKFHVNSPVKFMLYHMNLINYYTNIEIDFSKVLEEFNLLNKNRCIDLIFDCIPEREVQEFRMILDMVENDTMQNEHETHAFIRNQVERFGELFGHISGSGMEALAKIFNDTEKLTELLEVGKTLNLIK